ncbi:phage tail protein [Noviherbaspirillum cavernae]|uniref:Phage tail protein n=1 Tax=Noviherbaspirillum cavernae TaxID=2320862 RepID=A0A418X1C6_9BURK|nr:phage tail tube protein [Noviherbaspirillum cavernae]RJG06247.1 phage tail protein [Noviherbaspirillum cavernae]
MGKRVAGICYIKVNGAQLEVKGSIEVPLTDKKRETVSGPAGPAGYKEEVRTPFVKLTAIFRDDFPTDVVAENTDLTVTAELANGKVYTLSGGYLVGESDVKGDEGEVELHFEGNKGIWQ